MNQLSGVPDAVEWLMPAPSPDEFASLDAAVLKVLARGYDRWVASGPKEDLTLEVLARLTVTTAINEKGLLGAVDFLQSRIFEMALATAYVEIEGRRARNGTETAAAPPDRATDAPQV